MSMLATLIAKEVTRPISERARVANNNLLALSEKAKGMYRPEDTDFVRERAAVLGFSLSYRPIEEVDLDKYFDAPEAFLKPYYYSADCRSRWATHVAKYIYRCVGERTWDCNTIPKDVDFICGDAAVGYGYKVRPERAETPDFTWTDVHRILDEIDREIPNMEARLALEERRITTERRVYGHDIHARFEARGASRVMEEAWWAMPWRKETAPEKFMDAIYRVLADREKFALALYTWSGEDLQELGWSTCRSVPRTKALLEALSKATGVAKATDKEFLLWKERDKKWVFGE